MQWTKKMAELLPAPDTHKLLILMREALERFHKTNKKINNHFVCLIGRPKSLFD